MIEENKKSATGLAVICFIYVFFEILQTGVLLAGNTSKIANPMVVITYVIQVLPVGVLAASAMVLRGIFFLNIRKIGIGIAAFCVGLAGSVLSLVITIRNNIRTYNTLSNDGTYVTSSMLINVVPALISIMFIIMILVDFCLKHEAYVIGTIAAAAGIFMWLYSLAGTAVSLRSFITVYNDSIREVLISTIISRVLTVLTSALGVISIVVYYLGYARENRDWFAAKNQRSI